jgi:hypothetical protein
MADRRERDYLKMSGITGCFTGQQGAAIKCADVIISPNAGTTPLTIGLVSATANAHIFYRKVAGATGLDPTHIGDNAGPGTTRIGSNSGAINIGSGIWTVRALAYEPSHLDSNITEGDYEGGG